MLPLQNLKMYDLLRSEFRTRLAQNRRSVDEQMILFTVRLYEPITLLGIIPFDFASRHTIASGFSRKGRHEKMGCQGDVDFCSEQTRCALKRAGLSGRLLGC